MSLKLDLLKLARKLAYIFLLLAIFSGSFQLGRLYGEFKQPNESTYLFFTTDKGYEWNKWTGEAPSELIAIQKIYNNIVKTIYIALGIFVVIQVIDYNISPEDHFYNGIKQYLKKHEIND